METFNLKSSKFDVSEEGKMIVYFRHPEKGSLKVKSLVGWLVG
jgi:hypothetical protein